MKNEILNVLPREIKKQIDGYNLDYSQLEELRLRVGQPPRIVINNRENTISPIILITREHIKECMEYVSDYSLYAFENELRQGFITIKGGHRVGVCGKAIVDDGHIKNIKYIHSINIRVSHEIIGCANSCMAYIRCGNRIHNTLIISPPRCGKTTLLRDIIRQLSKGNITYKGMNIGIVDERSEIGSCYEGVPQNNLGPRTDILDGAKKGEGILMLLRAMSPRVIAMDEVGGLEDITALDYCLSSGCGIIATVHGRNFEEVSENKYLCQLINEKKFSRIIILSNERRMGEVINVLNQDGIDISRDEGYV